MMFTMRTPNFDLEQINKSTQGLGWKKIAFYKYLVSSSDKVVCAEQRLDRLYFSCPEEDFYTTWFEYFGMFEDYHETNYEISKVSEHLKVCANRSSGLRIMKQDLLRTVITFVMAGKVGIRTANAMVDSLVRNSGESKTKNVVEIGGVPYNQFPNAYEIIDGAYVFGKYEGDIVEICDDIINELIDLEWLSQFGYDELTSLLLQYPYFDKYSVDMICLHGLNLFEAFPKNRLIEKIIAREYGCSVEEFKDTYIAYNDLVYKSGIIWYYMIYNELNPPRRLVWG